MLYRLIGVIGFSLILASCATGQGLKDKAKEIMTDKMVGTELPYASIPDYPEAYTAGTSLGRLVDALGFRYYWATEGLREEDMTYDPGGDNRSTQDVLTHLYGLSETIVNAPMGKANIRPGAPAPETWEEKRKQTLLNFKKASDLLKGSADEEVTSYKVTFQRGENKSSFDFWHLINGPITDAIYHVGQITSYRRSSGNPINPTVNVFMGTAGGS